MPPMFTEVLKAPVLDDISIVCSERQDGQYSVILFGRTTSQRFGEHEFPYKGAYVGGLDGLIAIRDFYVKLVDKLENTPAEPVDSAELAGVESKQVRARRRG